jgi:flagellar basal-body rod modification protein FlgD
MVSAITSSINDLASGSTSTAGSQEVSSDQFLTLLIAQLQNQDPMNPIENQDFVAELATFSSLEQQQMQTGLLEQLI